jgi:uncharacterized integral membrane protein (TIGR00697 family)
MIAAILVSVAYVAAQIFSDIMSLRIVLLAGMSVDAGTLIYPFTFTLRDMVHKVAGIKAARVLIVAAGVINIIMAILFWITSHLPADPMVGAQEEFGIVLSPVWRIVIASIAAEVIAELMDTEAYRLWEKRFKERFQWARVVVSNAISVPIDSIVFVTIAFWGVLPPAVVLSIFVANVLIKYFCTIISIPGIYLVKPRHNS